MFSTNTNPEALAFETIVRALSREPDASVEVGGRTVRRGGWEYRVDGHPSAVTAAEVGALLVGLPVANSSGEAFLVTVELLGGESIELGVRAFGCTDVHAMALESLELPRWTGYRSITTHRANGIVEMASLASVQSTASRGF